MGERHENGRALARLSAAVGHALPPEMAELVACLLPRPWTIDPAAVQRLALRVQEAPDFAARVTAAGPWGVSPVEVEVS